MTPLAPWVVAGVVAAMAAAGRLVAGETDTGSRECGPVMPIGSPSALAALAPKDWLNRTGPDTITSDITSTVALDVHVRDVVPEGTELRSLGFDIRGVVPGLSRGPVGSGAVSISPGATFRIRFARRPLRPISSSVPRVTFEAPCRAACGPGERRCAEDDSCYAAGREYCQECSRESPERCDCVASDGYDQPDGTSCSYISSGSDPRMLYGECRAGRCRSRPR